MAVSGIVILPSSSHAAEGYGFSGLIQLTYHQDNFKDPDADSERTTFIQEYRLQYHNFVYNPKLVLYTIGASFMWDSTEAKGARFGATSVKTRAIDGLLKLDILQGTKYPFSVYAEKATSPSLTLQPDFSITTKQTVDRYGILGNVFLSTGFAKGVNLRYDAHQNSIKTDGLIDVDRTNRSFLFGIDRRKDNEIIDASYNYQKNTEKILEEVEAINDARVSVWLRPGAVTNVSVDSYYSTNSNTDLKTVSSNIKMNYTPTANFNSILTLYGYQLKLGEQVGDFQTFFASSTYRISEVFTTDENMTLYRSAGDFGEETIGSLTLGLSMARPLPYGFSVAASTSVNETMEKSEITQDRNTMYYNVAANVAKLFDRISTTLNAGGSYFSFSTSRGGSITRSDLNGGFSTRVIKNLTLQSTLDYYTEDTKNDEIDSGSEQVKKKKITSDSSLVYFLKLSIRATLDGRIGAFLTKENDSTFDTTLKRTFLHTDWIVRYVLRRNILLNAGVRYFKESINETKSIAGTLGADMKIKAVIIKYTGELWKEQGPLGNRTRTSMFLQVSRPF